MNYGLSEQVYPHPQLSSLAFSNVDKRVQSVQWDRRYNH